MNKIISIGWLGIKACYLNVPLEEAIQRFIAMEDITREEFDKTYKKLVHVVEFDDEFGAYEIWEEYNG
jgi:hypothetical protein